MADTDRSDSQAIVFEETDISAAALPALDGGVKPAGRQHQQMRAAALHPVGRVVDEGFKKHHGEVSGSVWRWVQNTIYLIL